MTTGKADMPADDGGAGKKKGKTAGPPTGRAVRRSFTPEYELAIVAEWERLREPGAKGALLRRDGLYHSHVSEWKAARDAGALNGLAAKTTGPKPAKSDADRRAERLEAENARLWEELERKDKALQILGKASQLLEMLSGSLDSENKPRG